MKIIFFTFLSLIIVNSVLAQAWVDSLEVARKAYKSGDYDKALRYYQSAQKQAPKDVDLSDEIAQSTYRSRDFKSAQKAYEQSAGDKKLPEERALVNHNLGNTRMKQKDYDGAISAYKESLRNNPNDPETKYNLSEAIRQKKQQEQQKKDDQKDNQCKNTNQNQNNNQNNSNNSNQKPSNQRNNGSDNKKMPNKQADKMLDDLTRKEAETKKRLAKNSSDKKAGSNSGKDW
jgi:tetratricopeptide (TPR) repeat protein